jgi:hypothetical protein
VDLKRFILRMLGTVKRGLNRLLGLVGLRLILSGEEEELRGRADRLEGDRDRMARELASVYREVLFPELEPRAGRIELLRELAGTPVSEAMYLLRYLQDASAGPGDICELGVAHGRTSALIANEILETDRRLWLFDSFEQGLSSPTEEDVLIDDIFELGSMEAYAHTMFSTVAEVQERLDRVGFPRERTRIVPGYIRPDLEPGRLPERVAFAYLDFDLYEPILTGLELMHPRCRPGSILMVDDYRFFSAGVEAAVNEFREHHSGDYELLEPIAAAGHFCALRRLG